VKTVVLISADGEWRAVRSLLQQAKTEASPFGDHAEVMLQSQPVELFHGGWGKVSASATTQYVIDHFHPDLLVNLGTCGGFEGRIDRGRIILVERTVIYDIVEQMTDADEAIKHYSTALDLTWLPADPPTPVTRGLLVSGDRDILVRDIPGLVRRYNAVAADWESGAIAWVANRNSQRLLILRGVSDLVGTGGGEAYGDYELFLSRTREIMAELLNALPGWLIAVQERISAS
jgi:adenosylhomocysteine nucleosidase